MENPDKAELEMKEGVVVLEAKGKEDIDEDEVMELPMDLETKCASLEKTLGRSRQLNRKLVEVVGVVRDDNRKLLRALAEFKGKHQYIDKLIERSKGIYREVIS